MASEPRRGPSPLRPLRAGSTRHPCTDARNATKYATKYATNPNKGHARRGARGPGRKRPRSKSGGVKGAPEPGSYPGNDRAEPPPSSRISARRPWMPGGLSRYPRDVGSARAIGCPSRCRTRRRPAPPLRRRQKRETQPTPQDSPRLPLCTIAGVADGTHRNLVCRDGPRDTAPMSTATTSGLRRKLKSHGPTPPARQPRRRCRARRPWSAT